MHPFIEWLDAGRPVSMETYNTSSEWLEGADMDSRGATVSDLLDWMKSRPDIYINANGYTKVSGHDGHELQARCGH